MMNSEQAEEDAIKAYTGDPKFKDILKKILGGSDTRKRVDNFLRENKDGINFMQEIPGYVDPQTGKVIREDQIAGLPFPYNPAGLPDDVYQATQKQYGKTDVFGPYTKDDMKLIQQYFGGKGKV